MPRIATSDLDELRLMVERQRERNRASQARWVQKHHEKHLQRMRDQYGRKKEAAAKAAEEDRQRTFEALSVVDKIVKLKEADPFRSQKDIAQRAATSQSKVSRVLAAERVRRLAALTLTPGEPTSRIQMAVILMPDTNNSIANE